MCSFPFFLRFCLLLLPLVLLLDIPDNFISCYGIITYLFLQQINLVWHTTYMRVGLFWNFSCNWCNWYFSVVLLCWCTWSHVLWKTIFTWCVPLLTRQVAFVAMLQLYKVKGELCYIVIWQSSQAYTSLDISRKLSCAQSTILYVQMI